MVEEKGAEAAFGALIEVWWFFSYLLGALTQGVLNSRVESPVAQRHLH